MDKLSLDQISAMVEEEGLETSVMNINAALIDDPTLREQWEIAQNALNQIELMLPETYIDLDPDDDDDYLEENDDLDDLSDIGLD